MDMPSLLRGKQVGALQQHAKEVFGVELTGTKPAILARLKELYEGVDATPDGVPPVPPAAPEEAALADEHAKPRKAPPKAKAKAKAAPKAEPADDTVTLETPTERPVVLDLVPTIVPYHGAKISRWPDHVAWLYNPANGRRVRATPMLRERLDLRPCTPPKE